MDAFKAFAKQFRIDDETGGKKFCIVQAEDELAAIGVVLGATWNAPEILPCIRMSDLHPCEPMASHGKS